MSDVEMSTGDNASEGQPEGFDGMPVEKGRNRPDESMGDTSGAENETHDEDDDSEDEEALVEIDPNAILPVKIRPNAGKVDYSTPEAHMKAGLMPGETETEENDPDFDSKEDETDRENAGDYSMQQ